MMDDKCLHLHTRHQKKIKEVGIAEMLDLAGGGSGNIMIIITESKYFVGESLRRLRERRCLSVF